MSVYISASVWRNSKATGTALLVLLSLADQADDSGECWPTIENIGQRCRISRSSVFRYLDELRTLGELSWDSRKADHLPNLYRVQPPAPPGVNLTPTQVPHVTPPGVSPDTRAGVTADTQNITKKRQEEQEHSFDEFWAAYPRRVGKGQAAKNWETAITKAEPSTIVEAATRFASQVNGTEVRFIPHPGTWLSNERWADEEEETKTGASWGWED